MAEYFPDRAENAAEVELCAATVDLGVSHSPRLRWYHFSSQPASAVLPSLPPCLQSNSTPMLWDTKQTVKNKRTKQKCSRIWNREYFTNRNRGKVLGNSEWRLVWTIRIRLRDKWAVLTQILKIHCTFLSESHWNGVLSNSSLILFFNCCQGGWLLRFHEQR